ncbi:Cytochrom B N 2 domain containing protein, partial [Asbolus verrucosus]
ICLTIQIATGVFLATHYCPNIELAFNRVIHICRDVNYGNSNSLPRICPTQRTNIILRRRSYRKPVISYSVPRNFNCTMNLRWIRCRQLMIHLLFLHQTLSNNPLGINRNIDEIPFHPYFSFKDILGFIVIIIRLTLLTLINPYLLGDPDNFTPANPLVT